MNLQEQQQQEHIWSRRHFLQSGLCAGFACGVPGFAKPVKFRYAVAAVLEKTASLQSFRANGPAWQQTDAVTLPPTSHLCAHPTLPVVYACHDVDLWDDVPRGVISAWHVRQADGALMPLGTQPLSLAATRPHFSAVIANGNALLVLTRAGIYNALPLKADGKIDRVTALRKEYGSLCRPAWPRHVVEHADGTLFAADSGQETISRYQLMGEELALQHRLHLGFGVRKLALSQCGEWLYASHADEKRTSVHRVTGDAVLAAHRTIAGQVREDTIDTEVARMPASLRACTAFAWCAA